MKHLKLQNIEDYDAISELSLSNTQKRELLKNEALFSFQEMTYANQLKASAIIDNLFDFNVLSIEQEMLAKAKEKFPNGNQRSWGRSMHDDHQTYVGLSPSILQTPYCELQEIVDKLEIEKNETVIDLGAAYGRMGIVCEQVCETIEFIGYEYCDERVEDGNNVYDDLNLENKSLEQQDIVCESFDLPIADYYFVYEFGHLKEIEKLFEKLRENSKEGKFKVVVRGEGAKSIVFNKHPWLTVFDYIEVGNCLIFSNFLDEL